MTAPLAAAKQQLRTLMKQRLAAVSQESVLAQSRQLFETLQDFPPYREASRISIYLSMPATEIQTDAIVRHALGAGKHVYVPYLHKASDPEPGTPARVMDMVHLRSIDDYEGLKRDAWGIPSIDPSTVHERRRILGGPDTHHSDQSTLDLMLLPGVAFDVDADSGVVGRLGHGKGFYDFFLNRYLAKANQPLQLYGLALTEQLLPEASEYRIPIGPYDRRLHGLILGDGNIVSSGGAAVTDE